MPTAEIRINLSVRMVHAVHVLSSLIKAVTPQIQFVLKFKMGRRHVDRVNRIGNVLGVVMNASMAAVKSAIWRTMQAALTKTNPSALWGRMETNVPVAEMMEIVDLRLRHVSKGPAFPVTLRPMRAVETGHRSVSSESWLANVSNVSTTVIAWA